MNAQQLYAMGVPSNLVEQVFTCFRTLSSQGMGNQSDTQITAVVDDPKSYVDDPLWGNIAAGLLRKQVKRTIEFARFGDDLIDIQSIAQMQDACSLPITVAGALMPDAHLGYGVPIGSVIAADNAVMPGAVGVDIACRMKMTVFDIGKDALKDRKRFEKALLDCTHFGVGCELPKDARNNHPVMDDPLWNMPALRQLKDTAWAQLGTSGSGNHFSSFGEFSYNLDPNGGFAKCGEVALMTHSGSRGTGAKVCNYYNRLAKMQLPPEYAAFDRLAWLSLDTGDGMEYWNAMTLMGQYSAANHQIIHDKIVAHLGCNVLRGFENSHNFAWKEMHSGQKLIVHRKGATPAGKGVYGIIPGDMMNKAYVVVGKGEPRSLASASHGAGRAMSRTEAKKQFNWDYWRKKLEERGVHVMSAGLDEVPGAYKNIEVVMEAQKDLVDIVGEFQPRIVRMSDDATHED